MVNSQALSDHLFTVILTLNQLASTLITDSFSARPHRLDVIHGSALHARSTACQTRDQNSIVDLKQDRRVDRLLAFVKEPIQSHCLRNRAWKTIQDEPVAAIRLLGSLSDQANHNIVRHECAAGHEFLS